MEKFIVSIFIAALIPSLYSQNERINCTVFIDGKLPLGIYDGHFSCIDSSGNSRRIDFDYLIGEMKLSFENKRTLELLGSDAEIRMNISYKQYDGITFNYSGTIKVAFLNYDYLIIRITNLDKKSGIYYFGYSTPCEIMKFIHEEYNMFEDFEY